MRPLCLTTLLLALLVGLVAAVGCVSKTRTQPPGGSVASADAGEAFPASGDSGVGPSGEPPSDTQPEYPWPVLTGAIADDVGRWALDLDRGLLACPGNDGGIEVWDLAREGARRVLGGSERPITALAFSPDGALLASINTLGEATLWDLSTGDRQAVLNAPAEMTWAHRQSATALVSSGVPRPFDAYPLAYEVGSVRLRFSSDGALLLAAGPGLAVWSVSDGGTRLIEGTQDTEVLDAALSADGSSVVSLRSVPGYRGTFDVGRARSVVRTRDLGAEGSRPVVGLDGMGDLDPVSLSPDGRLCIAAEPAPAGPEEGTTYSVYEIATLKRLATLAAPHDERDPFEGGAFPGRAEDCVWASDGTQVAAFGLNRRVAVWSVLTGEARYVSPEGREGVLGFVSAGSPVTCRSDRRSFLIEDEGSGELLGRVDRGGATHSASRVCAVTKDGARAYVDRCRGAWNLASGAFEALPPADAGSEDDVLSPPGAPYRVVWSPGSGGRAAGGLRVEGPDTRAAAGLSFGASQRPHLGHAPEVVVTEDGARIIAAFLDGALAVWDRTGSSGFSQAAVGRGGEHTSLEALATTSDGGRACTLTSDGRVWLWDLRTKGSVSATELDRASPSGGARGLALVQDGACVAIGRDDGALLLIPADGGEAWASPSGSGIATAGLAASPDGAVVALVTRDGVLSLWDVNARTTRWTGALPLGSATAVASLAFTPDGRRLLVGSWARGVYVVRASDGAPLALLRSVRRGPDAHWVAATPDGFWDGSEGAESIYGQREDNGTVAALDEAMHSPEKVREALAGGT